MDGRRIEYVIRRTGPNQLVEEQRDSDSGAKTKLVREHGCQMAIAGFLESYVLGPTGFWTMAPLRYATKFDPFLSLDCAPTPSTLAQSKERKESNFAIWQPCAGVAHAQGEAAVPVPLPGLPERLPVPAQPAAAPQQHALQGAI